MPERSIARAAPVLLALVLVACAGAAPSQPAATVEPSSAAASATAVIDPARIVVFAMGDSIPYNLDDDCPGCTGFVDSYSSEIAADRDESVSGLNYSRHDGATTRDILDQLKSDQLFLDDLATADVVLMSVGFNDQPPFAEAHDGCPEPVSDSTPLDTVFERAAATSKDCIDTVVQVIRDRIAEVFARVREQAPDAAIAALTAYDTWIGWDALDAADQRTRNRLHAAETYWLHQWRKAMCKEAEAVDAVCIDVYSAFNGADGTQPPADFVGADYTHPNQEGNDVIRDLLLEANLPIPTD